MSAEKLPLTGETPERNPTGTGYMVKNYAQPDVPIAHTIYNDGLFHLNEKSGKFELTYMPSSLIVSFFLLEERMNLEQPRKLAFFDATGGFYDNAVLFDMTPDSPESETEPAQKHTATFLIVSTETNDLKNVHIPIDDIYNLAPSINNFY